MISLHRLHHVSLRVLDTDEAGARWAAQFGLTIREQGEDRCRLSCDDERYCLELIRGDRPGFEHMGWELSEGIALADAAAHVRDHGAEAAVEEDRVVTSDPDGNAIHLLPYREPASRFVSHARPPAGVAIGHPRKLGHVNFLTGSIQEQAAFYTEALGMRVTDWLGEGGVWFHIGSEHHEMALVEKGYSHLHHMAFDVVDIGQMRMALDHLGRHGRWLGWGPTRHGIGGNIASYVRITEEECFVELYCDMERLVSNHEARLWADDRFSSNTWGPLPPRSYFRFDPAAVESERESLEMLGTPLPPVEVEEGSRP